MGDELGHGSVSAAPAPKYAAHPKAHNRFEDAFGRLIVGKLTLVAPCREFKRHNHAVAAFVCALAIFLVGRKEFKEKKVPKRPSWGIRS
jgi:hypothetical protein